MDVQFFSSGDLLADRRFSYAQMLAEGGDFAAATDLVTQGLERVPDFLPGLELLGRFAQAAFEMQQAFAAWRRMLEIDPEDRFGAELQLAAHGALERPPTPAHHYVETLFDAYAGDFDAALAQRLDYRVPQLMDNMLADLAGDGPDPRFARALDLGCGTGLMGERLRQRSSYLEGVDLSEAMVRQATAKRVYDRAEQGELLAWLATRAAKADLITAADVFAYLGALPDVFAAVARALAPGGLFLFSVEAHDGGEACVLRPSLRYAHSETGLREGLAASGFEILRFSRADIRMDRDEPIAGYLVAARWPGRDLVDDLAQAPKLAVETTPEAN